MINSPADPFGVPIEPLPSVGGVLFHEPLRVDESHTGGFSKLVDAQGAVIALVPGGLVRTYEEALRIAAYFAAFAKFCSGLPLEGILSGRYTVVDVDPDNPFSLLHPRNPAPRARLENAIIQLLSAEAALRELNALRNEPQKYQATASARMGFGIQKQTMLLVLADMLHLSAAPFTTNFDADSNSFTEAEFRQDREAESETVPNDIDEWPQDQEGAPIR